MSPQTGLSQTPPSRDGVPIAVLVSRTGTNLQALLDTVHGNEVQVVAVASGAPGALALERAASRDVPTAVFERSAYPDRETRDAAMANWLLERGGAYGVKLFGVTVHFVDAGVDSGAVISQRALELPDARDPEQVLAALR